MNSKKLLSDCFQAERELLGSHLLVQAKLSGSALRLRKEMFTSATHAQIYDVMVSMQEEDVTCDMLILYNELSKRSVNVSLNSILDLTSKSISVVSNSDYYVNIIVDCFEKLQARRILEDSIHQDAPLDYIRENVDVLNNVIANVRTSKTYKFLL